jgi:hypothetical protein
LATLRQTCRNARFSQQAVQNAESDLDVFRGMGYNEVQDLIAFRILTDTLGECYQVRSTFPGLWYMWPGGATSSGKTFQVLVYMGSGSAAWKGF